MNVDLFLNPHGEAGLLFDQLPQAPAAGVIFDAQTIELTIEMAQGAYDPLHLNIPVEERYTDLLLMTHKIYMGALKDGKIGLTLEVPLFYLNDPYGSAFGDQAKAHPPPRRSLKGFEQFMHRVTAAQAIHRSNLADDGTRGSVLRGLDPKTLEFVPELIRAQLLEQTKDYVANMAAQAVPGLGLGATPHRKTSQRRTDESET